jgi:FkbM family methyltransferase
MIVPIDVCDKKFQIEIFGQEDRLSNIIREDTIYSINDLKILKKVLNTGDYFVDAGANIGWHTLFASQLVGNTGKVFSFEPVKKIFNLLVSNINLNELKNTVAINSALTDFNGHAKIICSSSNFGDNMLCYTDDTEQQLHTWYRNQADEFEDTETIHSVLLDDYIKINNIDASKIKLIKMDIQGSESYALDGMKNLVKNYHPTIILEFSPRHMKMCGASPFDILAFIDKHDYIPYHIREEHNIADDMILGQPSIPDLLTAISGIFNGNTYNGFDLLLVHKNTKLV